MTWRTLSVESLSNGIVPFLTRRALGVASGYIGAGGNAGSTICMALFFTSASIETSDVGQCRLTTPTTPDTSALSK